MNRFIVLGLVLWAAYGARLLLERSVFAGLEPLPLAFPFGEYPMDVVGPRWEGCDLPMEDAIRRRAGISDFILRRYRRDDRALWFYVGYVTGGASQGIHHPGICVPASGLALTSGQRVTLPAAGFPETPVFKDLVFNEYVWTHLEGGSAYTLTTFHYNGTFDPEEWRLRAARLFGIRHFAVITITAQVRGSVEETRGLCEDVLRRALPPLLRHFPDGGSFRTTQ